MAADIYRPKDETKKYPIIFFRTPYPSAITFTVVPKSSPANAKVEE